MGQLNSIDLPEPGTQRVTAVDHPKSRWWLWVLILGVIALGIWYYRSSRATSQAADSATPGWNGPGTRRRTCSNPRPAFVANSATCAGLGEASSRLVGGESLELSR